jgi:hypothetical protein
MDSEMSCLRVKLEIAEKFLVSACDELKRNELYYNEEMAVLTSIWEEHDRAPIFSYCQSTLIWAEERSERVSKMMSRARSAVADAVQEVVFARARLEIYEKASARRDAELVQQHLVDCEMSCVL